MKKIGLVAVLAILGSMMWTVGCGGGTPNCDAYIAAAKACCDKLTDAAAKTACQTQMNASGKALTDAANAAGTDCSDGIDKTVVCP